MVLLRTLNYYLLISLLPFYKNLADVGNLRSFTYRTACATNGSFRDTPLCSQRHAAYVLLASTFGDIVVCLSVASNVEV